MSELPEQVKETPLCHLSIPGSHDSFTYSLVRSGSAGPDQPACIRALTKLCPSLSSRLLLRWSRTQKLDLEAQLKGGVRYFDIRLDALTEEGEREFRVLHCLLGDRIRSLLLKVRHFLQQHQGEVVLLDFQHTYQFLPEDHKQLATFILETFQGLLHPWPGVGGMATLASLQAEGRRALVIYPALSGCCPLLWPRDLCPTPWPDTTSATSLATFLTRGLEERDTSSIFISQGVLTPRVPTVLLHPFSGLRKSLGRKANRAVLGWLQEGATPNVCITDFCLGDETSWRIVQTLVDRNRNRQEQRESQQLQTKTDKKSSSC